MTTPARPVFYKPVFGNDNFMGQGITDVVDIAAFTAPVTQKTDAALVASAKKLSEK